jgi:hypothetical protein
MGRSPSIAEMEQKEDTYRAYLDKLQAQLSTKSQAATTAMDAQLAKFYETNGWDNAAFLKGANYDFLQQSEWSLTNVKKIIDAISKAVFGGGGADLPKGVTVEKTQAVSAALAGMENMELYIASKVFDVLSGIIESFGSSTSVSFNSGYKDEPIGNGFHLFATVSSDSYQSHDFFNNNSIYEYMYSYEIRFSNKEAKQQASVTLTKLYEDQIQTFTDKVEGLLTQLEAGKLSPEQYQSQELIYNTLIEAARDKLNQLGAQGALKVAV